MKETGILKLIHLVKEQIGSFDVFSNTTHLLFLKFLMESPDYISDGAINYKDIYEFKKAFDQAKNGKRMLTQDDLYLLFDNIDFFEKATTKPFFFHDLAGVYTKLFTKENSQSILLNAIDDFELPETREEMKELFETMLACSYGDVRRTCEHTTNRSLRTLVARILNVQGKDFYFDCFCGYSTMLLSIDDYSEYYGFDIDYSSFCVSVMIEMMLGRKTSCVVYGDFLEKDIAVQADKLFSDAPLGLTIGFGARPSIEYYGLSKDLNVIAIYKGLDTLRVGGIGVFAVPSRALTSVARGYADLRKKLVSTGLKAVIELPSLWAGTYAQTNLLVVEKGYEGRIEFISAADAGIKSRDKSVSMLTDTDIDKILNSYNHDLDIDNYSISVDRRDVVCANTFAISKYMTPKSSLIDYRSVKEIDSELNDLYTRLNQNIKK